MTISLDKKWAVGGFYGHQLDPDQLSPEHADQVLRRAKRKAGGIVQYVGARRVNARMVDDYLREFGKYDTNRRYE